MNWASLLSLVLTFALVLSCPVGSGRPFSGLSSANAETVELPRAARPAYCLRAAEIAPRATAETTRRVRQEIDAYLAGGGEINDAENPVLLHAGALHGDVENVRYLLSIGADVNTPDINGGTPLVAAVVGCHKDVAALLVAAGANINARDNTIGTPIEIATNTGQHEMLRILRGESTVREPTIESMMSACNRGEARSCNNLADRYRTGNGVAMDLALAAVLFRKACDGGNAAGCANLGMMHYEGNGVAQDDGRAAALSRKACDLGSGWGCNNLGESYQRGRGVAADPKRAATLFRRACDLGVSKGCYNLERFN